MSLCNPVSDGGRTITTLIDTLFKPLTLFDDLTSPETINVPVTTVRGAPWRQGASGGAGYPVCHAPECSLQITAAVTWQLGAHHDQQSKKCCYMSVVYPFTSMHQLLGWPARQ